MAKKWYMSKLVWLGVLEIAVAIAEYVAGLPTGTTIAQGIAGILTIIFRLITNKAVTK